MSELPPAHHPRCDFCSSETIRWLYPSESFVMRMGVSGTTLIEDESTGAWVSCEECHDLIEGQQWYELKNRSIESFLERHLVGHAPGVSQRIRPGLAAAMQQVLLSFKDNRQGPALAI